MSTQAGKEGITAWADKDGSFKRQVSSFRDRIEEGGKFAPEKGKLPAVKDGIADSQDDTTFTFALLVLGLIEL